MVLFYKLLRINLDEKKIGELILKRYIEYNISK